MADRQLGAMFMSNNKTYEVQRTNNFEVIFEGLSDNITLAVTSCPIPTTSNDPIELPYGNSKIKVAGAAYIFIRSGTSWTQQQKFQANDKAVNDYFGNSVAISSDGNTAIIGAYYKDSSTGAVYIFTRSGTSWSQQAKLQASDKATSEHFGYNVAISSDGNTAIIGAYYKNSPEGAKTGAAYIFTRSGTTWTEQAKLQASDRATNDYFGYSVAISSDGNTAIISAHFKDSPEGTDTGAAYIYS